MGKEQSAPMTEGNYLDKCMDAMIYEGNRIKHAWLMARASYAYTCSFIGNTDPSIGEPEFTRWYAFTEAAKLGWEYLWRKD